MAKEKIIAIITGPSAVGKTTVVREVLKKLPNFKASTTYTTREKRKKASEDKIMFHVSKEEFRELIDQGQFAEWAQFFGNFYGTSLPHLKEELKTHSVLMNIDIEGAKIIKKKFPRHISIFILPDDISDLKKRLDARDISAKDKRIRFARCQEEIEQADKFDYQIINHDGEPDIAVDKIIKILEKY